MTVIENTSAAIANDTLAPLNKELSDAIAAFTQIDLADTAALIVGAKEIFLATRSAVSECMALHVKHELKPESRQTLVNLRTSASAALKNALHIEQVGSYAEDIEAQFERI